MTVYKFYFTVLWLASVIGAEAAPKPIPFQKSGKLIIVQATVEGQTGNFILDTGIPNLVLNAKFFKGETGEKVFYGLNGEVGEVATGYTSVLIGDLQWNNVYKEVIPMTSVDNIIGMPIHGLLGTAIFKKYILLIDFQKLELELYPAKHKSQDVEFLSNGFPREKLTFELKGGSPLVSFTVGDLELKLTMDTGAEMNLLDNKYQKLFESHLGQQPKQTQIQGFGHGAVNSAMGKFSGLRTSDIDLKEMNTAFMNLTHFNRYVEGPDADGILGYEFLSQFRVAFDFKNQEMYLWEPENVFLTKTESRSYQAF